MVHPACGAKFAALVGEAGVTTAESKFATKAAWADPVKRRAAEQTPERTENFIMTGGGGERRTSGARCCSCTAGISLGGFEKSGKADGRTGSGTRGRWGGRPAAAASKGAAAEQGGNGDENQ